MTITLRQDQLDAANDLRSELRDHQSVLLRAECGWGKTVLSAYIAQAAEQKRSRVIFAVHRKELMRQTARTFDQFGIEYGMIGGGMRSNPFARVQIASAQSLANRPKSARCDLFIPDEAHLWAAKSRLETINTAKAGGAHIIPLTATPQRGNGEGLACIADKMVESVSAAWLIERGLLARYRIIIPKRADLKGLHQRGREYITAELDDRFDKPAVYGDRVDAYKSAAFGKRMIGFCYSRENGHITTEAFNSAGIPAAFLDGDTPDTVRRDVISKFAKGDIWALFNAQLFAEGFDLSSQVGYHVPIEAVGLYTPTQSLPRAHQMTMRCMRAQRDRAIILDHVNILETHGLPDDDIEYSLEGNATNRTASSERALSLVKCGKCQGDFRPRPVCPYCQTPREIDGREVEEIAAEMVEVDVDALRRARKTEVARARDLPALVAVARERGYKPAWIANIMIARGQKVDWRAIEMALRA